MARTRTSLLEALQEVIERTYDLDTGIGDIGRYVIGDEGYRALYGKSEAAGLTCDRVEAPFAPRSRLCAGTASGGARTLIRTADEGLAVSIYYPDSLVRNLERHNPCLGLGTMNIDAFNQLVEELDHFLVIAERFRSQGLMSLLDLELHANVTKYLVLKMFVGKISGVTQLSAADTAWIRFQVLGKGEFVDADPQIRSRYRQARRLAARYVGKLDKMRPLDRVPELRRFHRRAPQAKIAHINSLN